MRTVFALIALLASSLASAATLFISEFIGAPPNSVYYQAVTAPSLVDQTVSITGSSVSSSAFSASTGIIRIISDTTCHIKFGSAPTATATTLRIVAGVPEYFIVAPGTKVAVITE